jgi:hypothetical protein
MVIPWHFPRFRVFPALGNVEPIFSYPTRPLSYSCKMKTLRQVCMLFAGVGFILSLGIHLSALLGRVPSSGGWIILTFMGGMVVWISAALASGTRGEGRMGTIPISAIVEKRPAWLKTTTYFCFWYAILLLIGPALRPSSFIRLGRVLESASALVAMLSGWSLPFFAGAFSMVWGKVPSRDSRHESTPG